MESRWQGTGGASEGNEGLGDMDWPDTDEDRTGGQMEDCPPPIACHATRLLEAVMTRASAGAQGVDSPAQGVDSPAMAQCTEKSAGPAKRGWLSGQQ